MKRSASLSLAAWVACAAHAAPVPLSDDELAGVAGRDGVSLAVHLELNSTLSAGFKVNDTTTYAVLQGFGGVADLFSLTLTMKTRPDGGGDYLELGLPGYVGFTQFGFRALGAQTDPSAPITSSYGQLLLNGSGAMTGRVLLWAQ